MTSIHGSFTTIVKEYIHTITLLFLFILFAKNTERNVLPFIFSKEEVFSSSEITKP